MSDTNPPAFDILRNNSGALMLAIAAAADEPENPRLLLYGGAAHPVFRRTPRTDIPLAGLEDATLAWLAGADRILVAEMTGGEISRCYEVPIEQ